MRLIGTWLSPYASRVLIAARYKDVPIEIGPSGPPGSLEDAAVSPIGKIPVLVDGAVALPESAVILEYLEDAVPDPPLFPGNAAERANVRLVVKLVDTYSAPSFGPFVSGDRPAIDEATGRIAAALGYLEHFRIDGEFASGSRFSAADCALIPFFHLFERLQDGFGVFDLVRRHPALEAWWRRARASEIGSFARSSIDDAIARMLQAG